MKSLAVSALFALFSANALATVTQQCVTPSTTGVTSDCSDLGAYPPFSNAYLLDGIGSCTFTFTQPVSANSLTISLDSVEVASRISLEVNGSSYTSAAGDISILTGSASGGNLVISGSGYGAIAGNSSGGSGTIALTNSPPPSITSLKVTSASASSGHVLGVCFTAAPPAEPTAIPTLGEWAMIFMASLMAMFGIRRMRRSK